jgi:hypothetical protein
MKSTDAAPLLIISNPNAPLPAQRSAARLLGRSGDSMSAID